MNFKEWNLNKNDKIYLSIVIIFAFLSTFKMMEFSLSGKGILNPDTSLYLISALKYAGLDYYNICNPHDLVYTPIISFLTSLLFRLGLIDKSAIIIITGFLGFISYIGLYILFKNRFNPLLSLTGVIIYGSLSVVIFNLAKGLIDIPVISISIWVLTFAIIAIDKNPKYFLITLPLLTIAIFIKYITGFLIPLILFYYIMKRFDGIDYLYDKKCLKKKINNYLHSDEFKYITCSIVISSILAIIICKILILDFGGSLSFFQTSVQTFNVNNYNTNILNYNSHKTYYIYKFEDILFEKQKLKSILYFILCGLLGFGFLFNTITIIKNINSIKTKKISKIKNLKKKLIVLFCLSLLSTYIGFKYLQNHIISNICLLFGLLILFSILEEYNINKKILYLDLLFLAYFGVYFIFLSLFPTKVYRYILPTIPPFIYFVLWGLDSILNMLNNKFNNNSSLYLKNETQNYPKLINLIPMVLIILLLISSFTFMIPLKIERTNTIYIDVKYEGFIDDLIDVCDYINKSNPKYHQKTFASNLHAERTIRWYLQTNVTIINNLNPKIDHNLSNFNETDYIIYNKNQKFKNYHKIYEHNDYYIYYHN